MLKLAEVQKSAREFLHGLVLTIAPCFRILLLKITPRTCMINASTMMISQSFVLKWNFATSKGCFLVPMMSLVPMLDWSLMVAVLPMGSRLPNIGFSAPTPCSFNIFLSRMDTKSAPFFSITFNSCAPLVSKNEIELYRLNFVRTITMERLSFFIQIRRCVI